MSLRRRLKKVERDRRGGERVFVSTMDAGLSEAEQEAFRQSERERLGIGPNDLHVILRRFQAVEA